MTQPRRHSAGSLDLSLPIDPAHGDTLPSRSTNVGSEPYRGQQIVPVGRVQLLTLFGEPELGQHAA
jgi:hypothetical protein